jgi:radical SAM-linked protein
LNVVTRIRITFAKTEAMRYTSHLDLQHTWERTFRRAELPLAYSQGFTPHARIQLAAALPLGFTSQCERIDVWLENNPTIQQIELSLKRAVPPGIQIIDIIEVDLQEPAMQTRLLSAEYIVVLLDPIVNITSRITSLLDQPSLIRTRRGKSYDLRPLIHELHLLSSDDTGRPVLKMYLSAQEGFTGRPEEVLDAMQIPPENTRISRTKLFFKD